MSKQIIKEKISGHIVGCRCSASMEECPSLKKVIQQALTTQKEELEQDFKEKLGDGHAMYNHGRESLNKELRKELEKLDYGLYNCAEHVPCDRCGIKLLSQVFKLLQYNKELEKVKKKILGEDEEVAGYPSGFFKDLDAIISAIRKVVLEEALSKLPKEKSEHTEDWVEDEANRSFNQAIQESKEVLKGML